MQTRVDIVPFMHILGSQEMTESWLNAELNMRLNRQEQGQLYIKTAEAMVLSIARKYYARPAVLARLSQDAAQAQLDEHAVRNDSKKRK
jgi:hypothetical protein